MTMRHASLVAQVNRMHGRKFVFQRESKQALKLAEAVKASASNLCWSDHYTLADVPQAFRHFEKSLHKGKTTRRIRYQVQTNDRYHATYLHCSGKGGNI